MKKNIEKSRLVTLVPAVCVFLLFASQAFAGGNGAGNGGNAVKINHAMYLLDFVEAGIEKNPNLLGKNPMFGQHEYDDRFTRRFKQQISRFPFGVEVNRILHDKLMGFRPMERQLVLAVLHLYEWTILDFPLARVDDLKSPLNLSKLEVYQAAVRRDSEILINRAIWEKMDPANRAGLILHEVLYASLIPQGKPDGTQYQDSWEARRIVGRIFRTPYFKGLDQFRRNGEPVLSLASYLKRQDEGNILRTSFTPERALYEIDYAPEVKIYGSLEKSNLFPRSTIGGWPAEGPGQDLYMADSGYVYLEGKPYRDRWTDQRTREIIEMECRHNFPARGGKGFVAATIGGVEVMLKDYTTTEGPTKYVWVGFHAKTIATAISYPYDFDGTDYFEVKYRNEAECKTDLFEKAMRLRKTLSFVKNRF